MSPGFDVSKYRDFLLSFEPVDTETQLYNLYPPPPGLTDLQWQQAISSGQNCTSARSILSHRYQNSNSLPSQQSSSIYPSLVVHTANTLFSKLYPPSCNSLSSSQTSQDPSKFHL
uniref:AAA-type ATPase family protein n=1 Tax=Rhizophora mucronata TaxID=61149 RepID=A0A2P2QL10_RHIMU